MKDLEATRDSWNTLYIAHCKKGGEHVNNIMADWCEKIMLQAKEAYYNTSSPIMDDKSYDWIEDRLKNLRPDSDMLSKVGF